VQANRPPTPTPVKQPKPQLHVEDDMFEQY